MAAEAPAPAATPSLEDEVYEALKTTIEHAFEQSDDNNKTCLAVHKAMARAMADVVTDHKIMEDGEIDTPSVEPTILNDLGLERPASGDALIVNEPKMTASGRCT